MTAKKLYFSTEDDEKCYDLEYHFSEAKSDGKKEVELFEAVPDLVPGYFWCMAIGDCAEDGDCGKHCDDYTPKNGKSGMCKFKHKTFYEPGKKVTFKIN